MSEDRAKLSQGTIYSPIKTRKIMKKELSKAVQAVANVSIDAVPLHLNSGSIADGKWFIRILGANNVECCLIAYASSEDSEPSIAVIAQKVMARWNPEFASKKNIENAIDNGDIYKIELETSRDEITVGEYKFKPQNCLSCKKQ